jgi:hypothetical protein
VLQADLSEVCVGTRYASGCRNPVDKQIFPSQGGLSIQVITHPAMGAHGRLYGRYS